MKDELIYQIRVLLDKCDDLAVLDFILRLLQKLL